MDSEIENNGISLCHQLDESSQSSASTVVSNDSNNDDPEDPVVHRRLLYHIGDSQSDCSIDGASNEKNTTMFTIDDTEPITVDDSQTTKVSCDDQISSDDEVSNQELSLYYSDETKPIVEISTTNSASAPTPRQLSLLDQLDIIFEKICFTDTSVLEDLAMEYTCPSSNAKANSLATSCNSMDTIMAILGCNNASTTNEYDYFANLESHLLSCCGGEVDDSKSATEANLRISTDQPIVSTTMKVSRRGRAEKRRVMEQLLLERGRTSQQLASLQQLRRVRSFASIPTHVVESRTHERQRQTPTSSSYFTFMGYFHNTHNESKSQMLIIDDNMDGYDSDPCLPYSKPLIQRATSPRSVIMDTQHSSQSNSNKYWYNTNLLRETVEITMNSTWDLSWIHNDKPIQVQVWIEPGTILSNRSAMVEPCLMWRCLSPTATAPTRRKSMISSSSSSSSAPKSLRLLHICRVRPVTTGGLICGTNVPAMCRRSTSLVVKNIYNQTFYFQASTIEERDSIVHQWKVTIARLATLAVLEDTTSLVNEFFLDQRLNQYSYKV